MRFNWDESFLLFRNNDKINFRLSKSPVLRGNVKNSASNFTLHDYYDNCERQRNANGLTWHRAQLIMRDIITNEFLCFRQS